MRKPEIRRHLGQERELVQVVLDEGGHEGVDALVVGHPRAGGVGEHDVAVPIDVEQAGHAQQAVAAEGEGIEELVVDSSVDDVDLTLAVGAAHEDPVALDEEVAALHQRHAHLAGEERVLEVGRVVDAGGEHHRDRALARPRRGVEEGLEQQARIVVDGADRVRGEELGEDAVEERAVLEHVGHAARHPAVVLEDEVAALAVADDVGAHHVREDLPRRDHPAQLALVFPPGQHQLGGDHLVAQALLVPVDVEQEQVQRGDALDEAVLDLLPLAGGDDARHEVEGEDALEPLLLAEDGEGDALVHEGEPLQALAPRDVLEGEGLEDGDERRRSGLRGALPRSKTSSKPALEAIHFIANV